MTPYYSTNPNPSLNLNALEPHSLFIWFKLNCKNNEVHREWKLVSQARPRTQLLVKIWSRRND